MVVGTPEKPLGAGGQAPTHVEKEIDRVISALMTALSEKQIVKVTINQADAFWGYYVRGYDASGEEIFTEACVLDKAYTLDYDISEDSKIMFAIETLFVSLVERVLRDHGFLEGPEAGTYIKTLVTTQEK
jgi:hypothetical protein